jgi:hypothetical protein
MLNDRGTGFDFSKGQEDFFSPQRSAAYSNGTEIPSPVVKRLEHVPE